MSQLEPGADALKLVTMCLMHDLPEATIGDLNYVQKQYVTPDEDRSVKDMAENLLFGKTLTDLINEFNKGESIEAKLARDADQIALILDLKALSERLEKVFPTMVKLYEDQGFIWVMEKIKVTEKGVVEGSGPIAERVNRVYSLFTKEASSK